MKDEEMAEEYICNGKCQDDITKNYTHCKTCTRIKDFLAGLKAGRPQWHDINDTEPSKKQLGKQLLIRMESVIGNTDYDYLVYKYTGESITDVAGVIAWCEIPTFDKE